MGYDEAMRMIKSVSIPWAIVDIRRQEKIETYDSQKQIAMCCACCKARCTNCVAKKQEELHNEYLKQNKGGRTRKRDISLFIALKEQGMSRQQIIDHLGIANATYTRMNNQFKEEFK